MYRRAWCNKPRRAGEGSSTEGNRPFLDVLDLKTKASRRVWQSGAPFYECPAGTIMNESPDSVAVSLDRLEMLFTKETPRDPTQFYNQDVSQRCAGRHGCALPLRCLRWPPHVHA